MSITIGTEADAQNYAQVNQASWDARAEAHAQSAMYNLAAYRADTNYISDIVRFDLPRLPPLQDMRIVHLQCHIGTDTLSLARLGAASVTGLDFSPESLKQARLLADSVPDPSGWKVSYVQGDVYDSVALLGREAFDLVFTGIGALCWLPSVERWANVVADLLKPGGRFFIREGHPILWGLDDSNVTETYPAEQLRVIYPYFESGLPLVTAEGLSYVDDDVATGTDVDNVEEAPSAAVLDPQGTLASPTPAKRTIEFNHGLAETVQALINSGLRITLVEEHDSVPWNALRGRMEKAELGEYRLLQGRERIPLTYTIVAFKE
ncbi:hypothetical protein LTR84_004265 [Exophiala bonariae]|uniref:Methyltransferase type 11 domain-containing protein n=1 Tax=Exophiala bonariae TaxID=1690606 RepID=A0AAV9N499_9EURO|nr:hypothetical protein LTR84_004265 [Exophiala bonariae]